MDAAQGEPGQTTPNIAAHVSVGQVQVILVFIDKQPVGMEKIAARLVALMLRPTRRLVYIDPYDTDKLMAAFTFALGFCQKIASRQDPTYRQ